MYQILPDSPELAKLQQELDDIIKKVQTLEVEKNLIIKKEKDAMKADPDKYD